MSSSEINIQDPCQSKGNACEVCLCATCAKLATIFCPVFDTPCDGPYENLHNLIINCPIYVPMIQDALNPVGAVIESNIYCIECANREIDAEPYYEPSISELYPPSSTEIFTEEIPERLECDICNKVLWVVF